MMPVKKFTFDLVDHHLDHSATRTHQKSETIHFLYDKVCATHKRITILFFQHCPQATQQFPFLNDIGRPYNIWVIKDLITLRLKGLQAISGVKKKGGKKRKTTKQS